MTLLVRDLRTPAAAVHGEGDLWRALLALAPWLLVYLMSFLTLGIFWVGQQSCRRHAAHRLALRESARTGEGHRADHDDPERPVCVQAMFSACSASSTSRKLGMCWLGAILRPVSTLTCGALPCRCATSTARITS